MTKVLVVDDEGDIRELLIDELTDAGYETIEAENGAEALDRVYTDRPDIVLLDLMMPVLDGIQVLEVLKANSSTANLPVVLLTAVSAAEGEQRSLELGARHYITKPWEPGTIQTVIKVTLREGEQTISRDEEGEQTISRDEAGEQTISSDEAGEQTISSDGDGEQTVSSDGDGEQTVSSDGDGEQTISSDGDGVQSNSAAGGERVTTVGTSPEKASAEGKPDFKTIFASEIEELANAGDGVDPRPNFGNTGSQDFETSAFISTGDPQLNLKLGGGVPREGVTFIEGAASTGKSVLCQHFAKAALANGFNVSYFSSQHSPTSLVSQMTSLGLNPSEYYNSKQLLIKAIPIVGPSSDSADALSDLAREVKEMAANCEFVIIDDLAGVTNRNQASAIISFLSQCKALARSGNSIVIAAHPDGMSEEALIRVRSLSDAYLGLSVEKSGTRLNKVLEVFKVANAEFQTGNRVAFEVEPGMGIRVNAISKVNG